MKIDLEGAKDIVNSLMVDLCTIQRFARPDVDVDLFNETTGVYTEPMSPDGYPIMLYEGGCNVFNRRFQGGTSQIGGGAFQENEYWMDIPLDGAPKLEPRDIVTIVAVHAGGDDTLVNTQFHIIEDLAGTYLVAKKMRMTRIVAVPQ